MPTSSDNTDNLIDMWNNLVYLFSLADSYIALSFRLFEYALWYSKFGQIDFMRKKKK